MSSETNEIQSQSGLDRIRNRETTITTTDQTKLISLVTEQSYNEFLSSQFFLACSHGQLDLMKFLIQNYNIDPTGVICAASLPNYITNTTHNCDRCCNSVTLLHAAVLSNSLPMIHYIINELNIITIDLTDCYGYTPLHVALLSNKLDSVQYLIQHYYNDKTLFNIDIFTTIIEQKQFDSTMYLLSNHFETIKSIINPSTLFSLLAKHGAYECIKYLIDVRQINHPHLLSHCGTQFNNINYITYSPPQQQSQSQQSQSQQSQSQQPHNTLDEPIYQPIALLHDAVESQNIQLIDYLINIGYSPNALDRDGLCVLAHSKGSPIIFQHFIDKYQLQPQWIIQHCNIQSIPHERQLTTPLHYAVTQSNNNQELIDYFINIGFPINIYNSYGHPPIFYAKTVETMSHLITKHQADPNTISNDNFNILHAQIQHNNTNAHLTIPYLFHHNNVFQIRPAINMAITSSRHTPFDLALKYSSASVILCLAQSRANMRRDTKEVHFSSILDFNLQFGGEIVQFFLSILRHRFSSATYKKFMLSSIKCLHYDVFMALHRKINFVVKPILSSQPVNLVVSAQCDEKQQHIYETNRLKILQYLLSRGCDVNTIDKSHKRTPLLSAIVYSCHIDIIHCLVTNGANIHTVDKHGRNVLHYLFLSKLSLSSNQSCRSIINIINYFIELGVDLHHKDKNGRTPFMSFCVSAMSDINNSIINPNNAILIKSLIFQHSLNTNQIWTNDISIKLHLPSISSVDPIGLHQTDGFCNTTLLIALQRESYEFAKFLIQCGANIHLLNNAQCNVMHFISYFGTNNVNLINHLVQCGIGQDEMDITNSITGFTPFLYSICAQNYNITEFLLHHYPNVNPFVTTNTKQTFVHLMVSSSTTNQHDDKFGSKIDSMRSIELENVLQLIIDERL